MTLSYPRPFPTWFPGMATSDFLLGYQAEQDPTGYGTALNRDLGPTLWVASYVTGNLSQAQMTRFQAWLDAQENGGKTFWGYDFRHAYPLAYPNGFGAMTRHGGASFDGTCTLGTVADDNVSVPLSALPDGFQFSESDKIAFDYGGARALHTIVADVTGNNSGQATVEVRPHVRPGWEAGATVSLVRPAARMKLVPDSAKPNSVTRGSTGNWSFRAQQTLQTSD